MTFRVAVVGVGGMGACHAQHLAELDGVDVGWVADPDSSAASTLAAEVGAIALADGLAAIAEADGVVIASPDRFHFGYATAALERGIPVLCEKPLTEGLTDAKALVDAEVELGRRLIQVGFMREYDEPHVQVAAALAGLGPVNHIRSVHRNRNGGLATIEFDDAAAGYEVWVEVDAEGGNVTSAQPGRALVRANGMLGSAIGDDWFAPFLGTYRVEIQAWLGAAINGGVVGPSTWDGYAAQVVVESAARSADSGRPEPVTLPSQPDIYRRGTS